MKRLGRTAKQVEQDSFAQPPLRPQPQPESGRRRTARQEQGHWAEEQALAHLRRQGLFPVARNFHSRFGELDLIMRQGEVLVFVEVRARRKAGFASPADSIDRYKQRRLALAAAHFLRRRPRYAQLRTRFDVVCVIGGNSTASLQWIPNAFLLEDGSQF